MAWNLNAQCAFPSGYIMLHKCPSNSSRESSRRAHGLWQFMVALCHETHPTKRGISTQKICFSIDGYSQVKFIPTHKSQSFGKGVPPQQVAKWILLSCSWISHAHVHPPCGPCQVHRKTLRRTHTTSAPAFLAAWSPVHFPFPRHGVL